MRVAIVGLGLGGAAAGAALAFRGQKVSVFEQTSRIREVGAGIFAWPNAIRGLIRMGLGPQLAEIGVEARSQVCDSQGNEIQWLKTQADDGVPSYHVHRAEFLDAISSLIPRQDIHLGKRCIASEETENNVRLTFEDGGHADFDVVLAGDGIRSVFLQAVTEPSPPTFANLAVYRGLIPNRRELEVQHGCLWTDRIKYFLVFPVSGGRKLNFVGNVPTGGMPDESWFMRGSREELAAEFEGWDPRIGRIIDDVTETFRWGLYYRPPLPTIVSRRIALLGDAAHPMFIQAGQGANQAIEDGIVLGVLLAGCRAEEVPERLKLYQTLRLARATAVQTMSRHNAQFMHAAVPLDPGQQRPVKAEDTAWVIDHDVEQEAQRFLAESRQSQNCGQ